ncbi:phosphoribosyl-AMP cyclohydrolase [Rhizobium sp. KVB221]|uniref:Phosphoribosyl-AMP cyclohydrolase n=1 Tax=Rhizobium setariae TaxID=2801340 RepID=A0A936YQQ4_9HYPH|nr:phosphoribosyl-AMP cyclohydrolase [Rhizobium setariae]MBL0373037.1 phosphoribosyl-AMP cyclohydrolase [Rhizobium setariae]
MTIEFDAPSRDKLALEEGTSFTPKFDANGLITAVVTDADDNALLMVAHMNAEALMLTLDTGIAHYFSRSRGKIWKKGETSGNLQTVVDVLTDCDQDALLIKVRVAGHDATCHTGRRSCFYRSVRITDGVPRLISIDEHRHFVPSEVYKA